jgi:hypothetical protein
VLGVFTSGLGRVPSVVTNFWNAGNLFFLSESILVVDLLYTTCWDDLNPSKSASLTNIIYIYIIVLSST